MSLHTSLCDRLGITYPIVQSGMSRVAGAELVAEVSRAGGLGILAALRLTPAELRSEIARVRALTDRPFGVNQWLHPGVVAPADPAAIPEPRLRDVQHTLDRFRTELDLPHSTARPREFPALVPDLFEVILDERVPVWSIGLGNPDPVMVARCHERGIQVMAMATTVDDARALAESGVDVVVAQGAEAGGHRSVWRGNPAAVGTMVLVPQIVDAVDCPVVAAGGIADGRGVVAALALGAAGALLGTRFITAREAIAPGFFKEAVLEAASGDTIVSAAFTGLPMRTLANDFAREYEQQQGPVLPAMLQSAAAEDIFQAAARRGDREHYPMPAGQSAGMVQTSLGAADIVRELVNEATAVLTRIGPLAADR